MPSVETLFVMDPGKKEQKNAPILEVFRCLFYAVVVVFLLSCMGFLFLDYLHMKQKLAAIDDKMHAFELTLSKVFPTTPSHTHRDNKLAAESLHVRSRRAVTPSLQSLEKRLKVLETRYGGFFV